MWLRVLDKLNIRRITAAKINLRKRAGKTRRDRINTQIRKELTLSDLNLFKKKKKKKKKKRNLKYNQTSEKQIDISFIF